MNPNDPQQQYTPPEMPPQGPLPDPPQGPPPGQYQGAPQTFDQYEQQQQSPYSPPAYQQPNMYQQQPAFPPQPQYPPSGPGPMPQQPSAQPVGPPQYFESEKPPRGKSMVLLGGIIAAVLLLLVGTFLLVRNSRSDLNRSSKLSQAFIAAVNKKDGHKAYSLLSDAAHQGTKESDYAPFIVASGDKLQGKFSESQHQIQPGKTETRAYFLYEFPTASHRYARTIVQKKNGKWGVISFVHSSEKLELVPGGTTATINSGAPQ